MNFVLGIAVPGITVTARIWSMQLDPKAARTYVAKLSERPVHGAQSV
jgi:hypothetical protein